MLKKIRIALAALFFALITLLFLDFTGLSHLWFGWIAKIQLVPAILALNFIIVAVLLVVTLLFGRVYCSIICPLGVFQDLISWGAARVKKNRFRYSAALSWLRYAGLAVFLISLIAGLGAVVAVLEPYSTYGRIASELFAPLYRWGNNLLAWGAARVDSYAFYPVEVWLRSASTLAVAVITFALIGMLAWRNGRTWCNTICPVGTFLGFFSRFSLFRPVIDPDKCSKCSLCSRSCKASCIDYNNYSIDHSRCVACMNCLDKCNRDAIHYTLKKYTTKKVDDSGSGKGMSRRGFLSVAAVFAASNVVKGQLPVVDGGLAVIEDKKVPGRDTAVTPPGSLNAAHLKQHCTACQLCVSSCPNHILRPSSQLSSFMQPHVSFERGYCRPECTRCSEVCPTGAIKKIDQVEKSSIQIGRAVWISENCVVNRDEVSCTACERHCPTGAIELIARDPNENESLKIPVVITQQCIGCGACEYHCPARPFSAIYVEGILRHQNI